MLIQVKQMVVAMAQIAPCSAKDNQDYSIIKNNFSYKSLKIWTDSALATKSVMVMSPRIKKGISDHIPICIYS